MWSEVMDADAFDAFAETGDVFDPATAKKLHDNVYAAGNRARSGRGLHARSAAACQTPDALLKKRGLGGGGGGGRGGGGGAAKPQHQIHGPSHRRTSPRRLLRTPFCGRRGRPALCSLKAATRSRP